MASTSDAPLTVPVAAGALLGRYQRELPLTDQEREMSAEERREWTEKYCRETNVRFWGSDSKFRPVLVPVIFGDGKQPMYLEPMATRPAFYVIAGHSGWGINNWDEDAFCEHLESVYAAIENRFGNGDDPQEEDEPEDEYEERTSFPALCTGCGMTWGGYQN